MALGTSTLAASDLGTNCGGAAECFAAACLQQMVFTLLTPTSATFGPRQKSVSVNNGPACNCLFFNVTNAVVSGNVAQGPSYYDPRTTLTAHNETSSLTLAFMYGNLLTFTTKTCQLKLYVTGGPAVLGIAPPNPIAKAWWAIFLGVLLITAVLVALAYTHVRRMRRNKGQAPRSKNNNNLGTIPNRVPGSDTVIDAVVVDSSGSGVEFVPFATPIDPEASRA